MIKNLFKTKFIVGFLIFLIATSKIAFAEEFYTINFKDVPIEEYIRFAGKICNVNFLYEESDLSFTVTVVSEEEVDSSNVMSTLIQTLRIHGLTVLEENGNLVIHKNPEVKQLAKVFSENDSLKNAPPIITKVFRIKNIKLDSVTAIIKPMISSDAIIETSPETGQLIITDVLSSIQKISDLITLLSEQQSFFTYTPKNQAASDIIFVFKDLAENLNKSKITDKNLINTLKNVKKIDSTNTLLFTGNADTFPQAKDLLISLDQLTPHALKSLGETTFFIYKIKAAPVSQIISALKNTAHTLKEAQIKNDPLIETIESANFIPETNSILFIGDLSALKQIEELLPSFDVDLSQDKTLPLNNKFFLYNPQFQGLSQLSDSLKEVAQNLHEANLVNPAFMKTIESMKIINTTNSLLFTGDASSIERVAELLKTVDTNEDIEARKGSYFLYKLKNTLGNVIEEDLESFAEKLKTQKVKNPDLIKTLEEAKWIQETNSILLTGKPKSVNEAKAIIDEYDVIHSTQAIAAHDQFFVYKPKYVSPLFIENSLKETALNLQKAKLVDPSLLSTINNLKLIESTNSLAFSGTTASIEKLKTLIAEIDSLGTKEDFFYKNAKETYFVYEIKNAAPQKLINSIDSFAEDLKKAGSADKNFIEALKSVKYKQEINSLLFTGKPASLEKVKDFLSKLDTNALKASAVSPSSYFVYKPKYLKGAELKEVLQNFATHLKLTGFDDPSLFNTIQNIKWDTETKSLLFSGENKTIAEIKNLLATFDVSSAGSDDIINPSEETSFLVYKLQYHKGDEIQTALKQISQELSAGHSSINKNLLAAINTIQWIQITNSLLCSGEPSTMGKLKELIGSLDVPLKQVFIEMLVIETSTSNLLNLGLDWGGKYKHKNKFVGGTSNFYPGSTDTTGQQAFQNNLSGLTSSSSVTSSLLPFTQGKGFDIGIIGDIILHKGKSFLSLGSFLEAMQQDDETSIVMTPKLLAQDNKTSTLFVGENIPYIGSQTDISSANQSITQNLEYRDVGMSLSLTPVLGNGDTVTLDIDLSRTVDESNQNLSSSTDVQGILTSKTSMQTTVHIPDQSFLVLSGMALESKERKKTGIPCLGGLPLIGAAFSESDKNNDKKNIVIFIRPHIINSYEDMKDVTKRQENFFREELGSPSLEQDYEEAIDAIKTYED